MDFGNPDSQDAQKKGSVFAGISPAFAPAHPAQAPSLKADAESVAALKQKIDALEKNIIFQLEKKIAEQFKAIPSAPPPPPPPPRPAPPPGGGGALLSKIEELERRLGDFSRQASLSASQLRNIEESKISARREIEDLLKAVREQQKYSEIDRQMHAQLEKSWGRVEELEKKLMDFYTSVLALEDRRRTDADVVHKREEAASLGLKEAFCELGRRFSAIEGKMAGLSAESLWKHAETFRGALEDCAKREREETRGNVEAFRKAVSEQTVFMEDALAEFAKTAAENKLRFDCMQVALEDLVDSTRRMLSEYTDAVEERVKSVNEAFITRIQRENDSRFEKFSAKYADALVSMSFVESFYKAADEIAQKAAFFEKELGGLLTGADRVRLDKALGISGMLMREKFEAMEKARERVREESGRIIRIKEAIAAKFKDIFGAR